MMRFASGVTDQYKCSSCGEIKDEYGGRKVRGLLCHSCNVALGHFRDNPQIIKNALRYLMENEDEDS
jgi:hypothetical protein